MPAVAWADFATDIVEVNEPAELPQFKTLRITVTYDADTQTYSARWGNSSDYAVSAPSAATALRLLANRFEDNGLHGSNVEMMMDLSRKADVLCKYCRAPIFFAKLPAPSTRYLSFDPEPIDAAKLDNVRTARFSSTGDQIGRPQVLWQGPRAAGPTWVPHPETCGQRDIPPTNVTLKQRWVERRQFSLEKKAKVAQGLRDIVKDLNEGILNP